MNVYSIMDYIETWIGAAKNLYYFNETDVEITASVRLSHSRQDWFGTRQTLVCNKLWLRELVAKMLQLADLLKHLDRYEKTKLLSQSALSSDNDSSWGDLSREADYRPGILGQLADKMLFLSNIFREPRKWSFRDKSSEIEYIFSDDLYDIRDYKLTPINGFLKDLAEFLELQHLHGDVPVTDTRLIPLLRDIYTSENLDKIYEMSILFGFVSPKCDVKKADTLKIDSVLQNVERQIMAKTPLSRNCTS